MGKRATTVRAKRPEPAGLDLVGLIRDEIRRSGRTPYEVATTAGVDPSAVSRLLSGDRLDPRASTVSALLDALGYRVVLKPASRRPSPNKQPRGHGTMP